MADYESVGSWLTLCTYTASAIVHSVEFFSSTHGNKILRIPFWCLVADMRNTSTLGFTSLNKMAEAEKI